MATANRRSLRRAFHNGIRIIPNMKLRGGVAQLVEQRTHKPRVPRSIRGTATTTINNSRLIIL